MAAFESTPGAAVDVTLDGSPVEIPPERRSLAAIRSYLESIALQQQRIVCALVVDGESINLTQPRHPSRSFNQVDAETMSLSEVPMQLVRAALQQTQTLQAKVHSMVERVLINEPRQSRELWWGLSIALKEPLLTLSLLSDDVCGRDLGGAPLTQLRKWQLQQLGGIQHDIEQASAQDDVTILADAIEQRLLPWLYQLSESLTLWNETMSGRPHSNWQQV